MKKIQIERHYSAQSYPDQHYVDNRISYHSDFQSNGLLSIRRSDHGYENDTGICMDKYQYSNVGIVRPEPSFGKRYMDINEQSNTELLPYNKRILKNFMNNNNNNNVDDNNSFNSKISSSYNDYGRLLKF